MSLPERVCAREGCTETFTPRNNTHIYHTTGCGLKVSNDARTHGPTTELRRAKERIAELEKIVAIHEKIEAHTSDPPPWAIPKLSGENHGILSVLASDWHLGEVIRPEQVDWINAYNNKIAERRVQRFFEKTVILAREYLKGVTYDGLFVAFAGDIFSGFIHEELAKTNEEPIFESFLRWQDPIIAGLKLWAKEFKSVHVAWVAGNHGRLSMKPVAKNCAQENFDWLLGMQLAKALKDDKRFTWTIPAGVDARVKILETRYLVYHGDGFKGGSGIAGALSPLMLGSHRRTRRAMAAHRPYDVMLAGHFHQYMFLPSKGFLVNGSLCGFGEYAYSKGFEPEPPQQALWVTTAEHGITFAAPILVASDRRSEGW